MKKIVIAGLLVAGAVFVGSHAFAWMGHGHMGSRGDGGCSMGMNEERHERHLERMGVVLDLTQEQKEQLQTLHQQRQEQQHQLREQMHEQMATILTPEQLAKVEQLKEMRGERSGNYGEGKERGRHHEERKGSRDSD